MTTFSFSPGQDLSDIHKLFTIETNDIHAPLGGTLLIDNIRFDPVPAAQNDAPGLPISTETCGVVPLDAPAEGRVPYPPDQVNAWFVNGLEPPAEGQSSSAPLTGTIGSGLRRRLNGTDTDVTSLTVEFGTYSVREVLMALIADNWLHAKGNPDSDLGRAIKAQVRKALYPDEDDWKELVWVRGRQILRRGIKGLAALDRVQPFPR